jgi:hypothetical protein
MRVGAGAALALAPGLALAVLLSGCGGSSGPSQAATKATCQKVAAALSEGPDPDADPVGYAEAQILPLRQIHAPDTELRHAIGRLADAYASFFASDGKSASAISAVAAAAKKIDAICPGAAS